MPGLRNDLHAVLHVRVLRARERRAYVERTLASNPRVFHVVVDPAKRMFPVSKEREKKDREGRKGAREIISRDPQRFR